MSKGILGSVAALLAGAALAAAQQPAAEPAATRPAASETASTPPASAAPPAAPPAAPLRGGSCVPPDQIATPCPAIMNSAHPWNPPVPKSNEWPYIDEPWRRTARYGVPDGQFWVRGEYLLWALKEGHLPPLVTTGAAAAEGVLGQIGRAHV